ncbi:MAG: bifunctional adenosylcobinamide kinase/adenosylcobinamide-phosphate guanylyltransferase, partial [Nitrospirota bacterium]
MGKIIFITGGARSGKSGFGLSLAEKHGGRMVYIATA